MTTTRIGFTGDDLPEDHLLYDFDGSFYVSANVTPGEKRSWDYPGHPAEIEIVSAYVVGQCQLGIDGARSAEAAFLALIDSDEKLRDRVREEIGQEHEERRLCRMED